MRAQLAFVALYALVNTAQSYVKEGSLSRDRDLEIFTKYLQMDALLKRYTDQAIKQMLPYVLEANEHVNLSSTCKGNLFQLMTGIRKLTDWSIRFLDSTGKPQSGMMTGNLQMFGEYKQCFDTVVKKKDRIDFRGQYCSVIVKPVLPDPNYNVEDLKNISHNSTGLLQSMISRLDLLFGIDPRVGLCVPSGCTNDDISGVLNYLTKDTCINATVYYCLKEGDYFYWSNDKIVAVCVFAFLGLLAITSTILDNTLEKWKNNELGLPSKLLQCFSVSRNFPKLINTNVSGDSITCFHGIRVLSLFWVILCHEYVVQAVGLTANHALDLIPFVKSFSSQIVLNGFTATEIFFLLGGFVNCYVRVNIQNCGKPQPSIFTIMMHRLWRLYPTLIVGFFILILMNHTGAPFYYEQNFYSEVWRKHWWKNFLFINNFFKPFNVSLPHTWYIAVDMQIFLLSLITVPVLLKNEKLGMYLHIGIIFVANISCFLLWWIRNLPPSPTVVSLDKISHISRSYFEYHASIYMLPLLHIASYYIGIVLGYVVAAKKTKKFSKVHSVLGWLAASFLYVFVMFLTYRWNSGTHFTKLESSLYGSLSKSILVLAVSWMVYCCITGQARFVNYILSLKIWMPISRLTYMLYMVSIIVQTYFNTNLNFPPDFASMFLIWSYFGNLSVSLLMSLALVLLVESPFLALEKILFRGNRDKNKSSTEVQKEMTLNGEVKENGYKENEKIATIHL